MNDWECHQCGIVFVVGDVVGFSMFGEWDGEAVQNHSDPFMYHEEGCPE